MVSDAICRTLTVTPDKTIKIIQDWYRTQYPDDQYVVVMIRTVDDHPLNDKTYIAKSILDIYIYHQLIIDFKLEDQIKDDVNNTVPHYHAKSIIELLCDVSVDYPTKVAKVKSSNYFCYSI